MSPNSITTLPLNPDYRKKILDQIYAVIDGNGATREQMRSNTYDGALFNIPVQVAITLGYQKKEHVKPGLNKTQGTLYQNAEEAQTAIKTYQGSLVGDTANAQKITDIVKAALKDNHFRMEEATLPLSALSQEFTIYQPCQHCHETGNVSCKRCFGKGYEQCAQCYSKGQIPCPHCKSTGQVKTPQGMDQCTYCHGDRVMPCPHCHQKGEVQCRICNTKGKTACPQCKGQKGASTTLTILPQAMLKFIYPKNGLPKRLIQLLKQHKLKLTDYADINFVQTGPGTQSPAQVAPPDENNHKPGSQQSAEDKVIEQAEEKEKPEHYTLHYTLRIPYAELGFSIQDEDYKCYGFGNNIAVESDEHFLDHLIVQGLRDLKDATDKTKPATLHLKRAAKFKIIREGVYLAAKMPLKRAALILIKNHKVGTEKETLIGIVKYADKALQAMTKGPRIKGKIIGLAAATTLFILYFLFLTFMRSAGNIGNPLALTVLDSLMFGLGIGVAVTVTQMAAKSTLHGLLQTIIPGKDISGLTPKIGQSANYILTFFPIILLIVCEIFMQMNLYAPWWYYALRSFMPF